MKIILKKILPLIIMITMLNSINFSTNFNNNLNTQSDKKESDIFVKDVKVGDVVEFGKFYDIIDDSNVYNGNDDDNIVKVPIKWKVLDQMNEHSLLISVDILKTMPYNYSWSPTNWKDSDIRRWLNYDFYDIAFDAKEKNLIKKITTVNTGNPDFYVKNLFYTTDYVFLLSIEEAKKYYTISDNYMAVGTKYAKREGLWISSYISSKGYSVWWLRSPGKTWSSAAIIHAAGSIGLGGDGVATRGNGVRPCIWVKTK